MKDFILFKKQKGIDAKELSDALDYGYFPEHMLFLRSILPHNYELIDCYPSNLAIRCKSLTGIRHKSDNDDDEHWGYIKKAIHSHFAERNYKVSIEFNTHAYYQDFTIYILD